MKLYESIKDILREGQVNLQERAWEHELKAGKGLREAINSSDGSQESWVKVLEQIKVCCEELKTYLGEDDSFVNDLVDDCDFYIDTIDTEEDESNIDYCLDKLYDICDGNNIWVSLGDSQQAVQEATEGETIYRYFPLMNGGVHIPGGTHEDEIKEAIQTLKDSFSGAKLKNVSYGSAYYDDQYEDQPYMEGPKSEIMKALRYYYDDLDEESIEDQFNRFLRGFKHPLIIEVSGSAIKEAANPENAEANALIKQALDSKEFAVEHKKDLEKLGLRVDVSKYNIDGKESIRDVILTGPNGRKLKSAFSKGWSTSEYEPRKSDYDNDTQATYNNYNNETGEYENYVNFDNDFTLDRRTYGESKRQVSSAKEELPRLKKRLSLYAKRYGENSSQYRELKRDIDSKEATVAKGIQPTWSDNKSNDIDYLNYLNKPFRSSRPKARDVYNRYSVNNEPVDASNDGTEIDKANELTRKYKKTQQYKRMNDRQKEDNLRRDKEDEERVQDIIKRNKEEKDRRDFYTAREDERINKDFSDIQSRLDAYKKRLGKKESELHEAIEQKYEKSNPDYNRFLRDVKRYTGSYDYLFGGRVSTECYGYPVTVNYFYYNRPYVGGGNNVVVNVLTPYGTFLGESIQDAINGAFEKNSSTRLSNKEIKETILKVINSMNKK